MLQNGNLAETNLQVCSRCIYDERVNAITFDENGVCNYCRQIDELQDQYGTGNSKGEENFKKIIDEIKASGKGKKYDWTEEDYQSELNYILEGCKRYAAKYERGMCEEHIRDYLAQAIRQDFVVSFNLRSVLHFLDLRSKLDAQLEIQALCEQMCPIIQEWAPEVWDYYETKRLHRAKLSP